MLKISTCLLTAMVALFAAHNASAQTELNSLPQPGRTGPATAPTPAVAPYSQALAPDPVPHYRSSLSLELGWGAPYGFGLTYAHHLSPAFDVNGGLGIGVGGRVGVGARYYLLPKRSFTPYLGVNLVRAGSLSNANIELDGEKAVYSMTPSGVLHLRGGLRWQPGRIGLLATAGYGIRFTGDPVTYGIGYNPSQPLRDLVQALSPGGAEVSVGIVIGLGH